MCNNVVYIPIITCTLSHEESHDVGSLQSDSTSLTLFTSVGDVMTSLSVVTLSVENHRINVFRIK